VDLFEYQGKQYFARYDIPVSPGGVATTVDEAVAQADAAVVASRHRCGGR
jgi:succinyl-CoA synthetase beta subunit